MALEVPIELEFRNVDIHGGKKTGEPREKPSEQAQKPTTNSTHLRRRVWESNPGHIDGMRASSPLRHPFFLLHCTQLLTQLSLQYFTTSLNIINRTYGITQLINTRSHTNEQVNIAKSHLFEPDMF